MYAFVHASRRKVNGSTGNKKHTRHTLVTYAHMQTLERISPGDNLFQLVAIDAEEAISVPVHGFERYNQGQCHSRLQRDY